MEINSDQNVSDSQYPVQNELIQVQSDVNSSCQFELEQQETNHKETETVYFVLEPSVDSDDLFSKKSDVEMCTILQPHRVKCQASAINKPIDQHGKFLVVKIVCLINFSLKCVNILFNIVSKMVDNAWSL